MRVVIAGGTGFLGRPLSDALLQDGHEVFVLTRALADGERAHEAGSGVPGLTRVGWGADGQVGAWASVIDGADAVVNLAGESIAAKRWSEDQKRRIRDSRLGAAGSITAATTQAGQPPRVVVSASAVGYYGDRGDETLTEASPPGSGFLSEVCIDWEAAAQPVATERTRLVLVRTGVVLAPEGGALEKMVPPFRYFGGGPLGSGRQYMAWIHRIDWLDLVEWAIETDTVRGVLNATAPNPVTNARFSAALGKALGRPSWLPAPAFALRLAVGEMADALLLSSQRVMPTRATELGFRFQFADVDHALQAIFRR